MVGLNESFWSKNSFVYRSEGRNIESCENAVNVM
jgi:hypothetical protein